MNLCKRRSDLVDSLILITIAINLIGASYVLLMTPPAKHYEVSIYWSYPRYFWLLILSNGYLSSIFLLIRKGKDIFKKVIILNLFLINFIFVAFPIFRGYFITGRCDQINHLFQILSILRYSHIIVNYSPYFSNVYPASHVLTVILYYVWGGAINITMNVVAIIGSLTYLLMMSCLIAKSFEKQYIGHIFVQMTFLTYGLGVAMFLPNVQSFLVFYPLYFWILQKRESTKVFILSALLTISLLFFHPMTLLYSLVTLLVFVLYNKESKNRYIIYTILIGIVTFSAWIIRLYSIQHGLRLLIFSLSGKTPAQIEKAKSIVTTRGLNLTELIPVLIKNFGDVALLYISWMLSAVVYLKNFKNKELPKENILRLMLLTIIFSALVLIALSTAYLTFSRLFKYLTFFSVIGIVLLYPTLSHKYVLYRYYILLLIVSVFTLSVFSVYPSPYTKLDSQHYTKSEFVTTKWVSTHVPPRESIYYTGITLYRSLRMVLLSDYIPYYLKPVSESSGLRSCTKCVYVTSTPGEIHDFIMFDNPKSWLFYPQFFKELPVNNSRIYISSETKVYSINKGGEQK